MRGPGLADLDAAVRFLLTVPPGQRPNAALRLIEDAHSGDKMRKRGLSRSGSLAGTAERHIPLPPSPRPYGAQACAALSVLLDALETWRSAPARFSRARKRYSATPRGQT